VFICDYLGVVSTEVKGKTVKKIETFPMIVIIIVTSILSVSLLILNQNHITIAQQQPNDKNNLLLQKVYLLKLIM
jgi:cytoskeletal protein RodZ